MPATGPTATSSDLAARMEQAWRDGVYFDYDRDEPIHCALKNAPDPVFDPADRYFYEGIIIEGKPLTSIKDRMIEPLARLVSGRSTDRWLVEITKEEFDLISQAGRTLTDAGPHLDLDPDLFEPGVLNQIEHTLWHLNGRNHNDDVTKKEIASINPSRLIVYLRYTD